MVWFKALVARYRITTVLRWVYCVAAVIALPFGLKEIVHTDYAAIAVPAAFPDALRADGADLPAEPDAELCAQECAGHGVEHLYLPAARAGDRISVGMGLDKLHADTVVFALVIFVGVALVLRSYSVPPRHPDPPGRAAALTRAGNPAGSEQSGMRVGRTRGVPVPEFGETNIGTEYCLNGKKESLWLSFFMVR